jgi:molybdopterin synthase catalytic subunit
MSAQPAEVDVQYYAAARELCGCDRERVALPAGKTDGGALLDLIAQRHPRFAPFARRMRLAVNDELVALDAAITPGDLIAVLPPVAGGSSAVVLCAVRDAALSVDEVLGALQAPAIGGISLFVGTVRDHAGGKPVARLDYEAHPHAARDIDRVLAEIAARMPGIRLAAVHRTGQLAVGDLAVIVGAASAHRAEAFTACREAIERIKERVPIWKKEWAPDGSAHWVNLE